MARHGSSRLILAAFVDTNVFVHYIVAYNESTADRCRELFQRAAAGEEELETSSFVLAEVVWVLQRPPLRLGRAEIVESLQAILLLPGLRLPERSAFEEAVALFAVSPRMNLVDACIAVTMSRRNVDRIYTLDRDFDELTGITRLEP